MDGYGVFLYVNAHTYIFILSRMGYIYCRRFIIVYLSNSTYTHICKRGIVDGDVVWCAYRNVEQNHRIFSFARSK